MPPRPDKRARAAALFADLLREQGLRVGPGAQSFTIEVDGVRFDVDLRGHRLVEPGELADLRRQLAAAVEKDPWRFGEGKCGKGISKSRHRPWGGSCSRRSVVAVAFSDRLSKPEAIHFVFTCAQHAEDYPNAKKVPLSEESLKGFAKVWTKHLENRRLEKLAAIAALHLDGKCGHEDSCGGALCDRQLGHAGRHEGRWGLAGVGRVDWPNDADRRVG